MSAATDCLARPAERAASTPYLPASWQGEVVRLIAAPPRPLRHVSVPQAVDALALLSSARVRLRLNEAPRGDGRWIESAMAAAAFVAGRSAWMPGGVAAWIGHVDLPDALAAVASGLLATLRASGMSSVSTRWRAQWAVLDGRFLDARSGPDRPALWASPGAIGRTHAMATRIAAAGLLAGVLIEGGRVVTYRASAIRLRPLAEGFDLVVKACGEAVATRINMNGKD